MEISFISIKDFKETISIYIKSKNIVILTGYETDDIIEKNFDSLLEKYQEGLEEKMQKSNLFLIVLMHYIISSIEQV